MSSRPVIVTPENRMEWRRKGVGGSDAPIIMGASPWCDAKKLLLLKTGQILPDPPTFVMKRGIWEEPRSRWEYERITGTPMPKRFLEHSDFSFVRGSYDGLNDYVQRSYETKFAGKADHLTALNGEIPKKYIWQCVHLAFLCGYEELDYHSRNPRFEPPFQNKILRYRRNRILEKTLLTQENLFWKEVLKTLEKLRKEKPMENGKYTVQELIELMKAAKEIGYRNVSVPGFGASMDPMLDPGGDQVAVQTGPAMPAEQTGPHLHAVPEYPAAAPAPQPWGFPMRQSMGRYPTEPYGQNRCQSCGSPYLRRWQRWCDNCYGGNPRTRRSWYRQR